MKRGVPAGAASEASLTLQAIDVKIASNRELI